MLNKINAALKEQITRGATAHKLALTVAVALVLATFPLFGFATVLCFVAATVLGLNQPLIQVINYSCTPLHLILIPVFLRAGEWIVGATPISVNPAEMVALFGADRHAFFAKYGMAIAYAILAWAILSPVAGVMIYAVTKPIFRRMRRDSSP